jgi:hypothetical protein
MSEKVNENENEKPAVSAEEKKNNRFSFIVGMFIAMAIIIVFTIFFR